MKLTSPRVIVVALVLGACTQPDTPPSAPLHAPDRPQPVLGPGDATVVMRGLNNPRGLAFGPDGALYVVDALAGSNGVYRVADDHAAPELVVSGVALVGVAFGPSGEMVVVSNETAYRFD